MSISGKKAGDVMIGGKHGVGTVSLSSAILRPKVALAAIKH